MRAQPAARALARAASRAFSDAAGPGGPSSSSWLPGWAKRRLPPALGGEKADGDLTLDAYAATLKRTRQLGALTGFAAGTPAAGGAGARGVLREYEKIIEAMSDAQKASPDAITPSDVADVAARAGVPVAAVEDCLFKFRRVAAATRELARRQAAGEPMPTSLADLEATVGRVGEGGGAVAAPRAADGGGVPAHARGPSGPCPFVGHAPARNAPCPQTGKKFKQCCGKGGRGGGGV